MLKKSTPIALLALSLAGLFLGLMLTSKHFDLNHAPPGPPTAILGFDGMCGDGGGCAEVNTSKYAKISLGEDRVAMPVSIPAVGFFFMMAILAAATLRTRAPKREQYLAVGIASFIPALAFGLYLLGVQALVLSKFCVYCLGLDAVTLLAACCAYLAHGGGVARRRRRLRSDLAHPALLLAAGVRPALPRAGAGGRLRRRGYFRRRGAGHRPGRPARFPGVDHALITLSESPTARGSAGAHRAR